MWGDADLSGVVDLQDFNLFQAGFNDPTLKGWAVGDFNYDGVADNTGPTAVPEPGSLVLLGLGGVLLLKRRRGGGK